MRIWTEPNHIKKWNNALEDWHTSVAENDLRSGGSFLSRMEDVGIKQRKAELCKVCFSL
jgi:uncharacterized protein YndB with AHSA1/START domain